MAPVAPSTPDGMSTASTGTPEALIERARGLGRAFEAAAKARAVHRIDDERRSRQCPLEVGVSEADLQQELFDPDARLPQPTGGHPPVGSVVALPGHDGRPATVRAAEHAAARGARRPDRPARPGPKPVFRSRSRAGRPRPSRPASARVASVRAPPRRSCRHRYCFQWSASRTTGSVRSSTKPIRPSTSSRMTGSNSVTWSAMAW